MGEAVQVATEKRIRDLFTASSPETMIEALNMLKRMQTAPGTDNRDITEVLDNVDQKRDFPAASATVTTTMAGKIMSGKGETSSAKLQTAAMLFKNNAAAYIPETFKQIDLDKDPGALAQFATSVGLDNARAMAAWQNQDANGPSVPQLVLAERIAAAKRGVNVPSVVSVLDKLREQRRIMAASNAPRYPGIEAVTAGQSSSAIPIVAAPRPTAKP